MSRAVPHRAKAIKTSKKPSELTSKAYNSQFFFTLTEGRTPRYIATWPTP